MKKLQQLLYTLTSLTLMIACSPRDADNAAPVNGTAVFQVRMTDTPAQYEAVLIDIQEIYVHSNAEGWQAIETNSGIYNLLELTNGRDTIVAVDELPSGFISQIRFVLGDNNSVVIEGDTLPLIFPGGQPSGLKLNLRHELGPGFSYSVLIDFDASASIVQTGKNKYQLKPVLKVIALGTDGSIRGQLAPQVFAQIYAIDELSHDTIGVLTNDAGRFLISGLKEGNYRVEIWPLSPYAMQSFNNVKVINGVISDSGIIVLQ